MSRQSGPITAIVARIANPHSGVMAPQGTLGAIKAARSVHRQSAVEALKHDLRAYARQHNGRFWRYGSAVRHEMRDHSDVDILVDFVPVAEAEARPYAAVVVQAAVPGQRVANRAGTRLSGARRAEVDDAVASAVRHFRAAIAIYKTPREGKGDRDADLIEMGFMHAMQSGHSSMESALVPFWGCSAKTHPMVPTGMPT